MLTIAERLEGRGKIILRTIHGSRLYGLSNENSDEDYYFVTEHGKSKHFKTIMTDGTEADVVIIGLDAWLNEINKGTHQAIEALMSPVKQVDVRYKDMLDNMRVYSPQIRDTYVRVIKNMAYSELPKRRAQAVRMVFWLKELQETGRFSSRLNETQISVCKALANEKELTGDQLIDIFRYIIDIPPSKEVD